MLDAYTSTMRKKSWGKNDYARVLIEVSSLEALKESLVVAIPFPNKEGHSLEIVDIDQNQVDEEGFTKVNRRNGKKQSTVPNRTDDLSFLSTRNSFESLMNNDSPFGDGTTHATSSFTIDPGDDDDEEVENVYNEYENIKGASTPSVELEVNVKLCSKVFKRWNWTSNEVACLKGSRIILGWNPEIVNVVIISFDAQVMHACVFFKADKKEVFCSFIYAHNRYIQRRDLWHNLTFHKSYVRNRPWCILGDFNVALSADDKSVGTSNIDTGMRDFQECIETIEVSDVNSTGLRFTWNQKPKGSDGILKKIDRIMANLEFVTSFVGANAVFQPYRISDHAPAILRLPMNLERKPRPFKFYNLLVQHDRFKEVVTNVWSTQVSGFWIFKVVKRLKLLKKPFRNMLYDHGNLHDNVKKLRHELDEVQRSLDSDPSNVDLREEEAAYLKAFQDAIIMEERLLLQNAKIDWLKLGNANTAYFHKVVKSQAARNRIDSITTMDGVSVDGDQVPLAFINHYSDFLGQPGTTSY
ncbi:RNA-directed DNA polymerase, eukaryota, reverse transcriptase zinc-binding domain protein [Tanacetum coccineum]